MKKIIIILMGIFAVIGLIIWFPKDFGTSLPGNIPMDAVIVEGTIIQSKEDIFENGKGYVIVVESNMSFEDTLDFIVDGFNKKNIKFNFQDNSSSQQKFGSFDADFNEIDETIEVVGIEGKVTVNHAVHMRKWILP